MNISVEEYNRVLDGLRTQLYLQNKLLDEKINQIKTQGELLTLTRNNEAKLSIENADLKSQLSSVQTNLKELAWFCEEKKKEIEKLSKKRKKKK